MKDKNQKKKGKNNSVGTAFAAMTGAVIGVGMAVAGAVVMKDKKNQAKVKKVFTDVKNQAADYMGKIEKEIKKDKKIIDKKTATAQKNIKKTVKDIKSDITKGVKKL